MNKNKYTIGTGLATLLLTSSMTVAQVKTPAEPTNPASPACACPGHGPGGGMMGQGMGPGMGMGQGMGPGMGMGQGMMGMGPGGMGAGMGLASLNLSEQQQKSINKIMDDHRRQQHDLMGKAMDQQAKLRDLYMAEKWDADAIVKAQTQLNELRTQMVRSRVQTRNQIYDQLTPDQRTQFRHMGPGWAE